jgi:hypothetical protein
MSAKQIEKKVEDYLRDAQALEDYWQRPITGNQLQAEMERIASHTKQPEVLREIFAALGNDPLVIAECLARPVLVEHMVTNLDRRDQKQLGSSQAKTKAQVPREVAAIDSIAEAVQVNRPYHLPAVMSPSGGCADDTWTTISTTNAPAARASHTAVWTGSEMIVWGGYGGSYFNTGGRYNPSTDSWAAISNVNAPSARGGHTAVWTGDEMIVWGGDDGMSLNTGGRYNPATNTWTATSTTNAPLGRVFHTAVWSGSQMIVWGGWGEVEFNTGGRYDPSTDSWTAIAPSVPAARSSTLQPGTGNETSSGGWNGVSYFNSGGNTTHGQLDRPRRTRPGRRFHTAEWSGTSDRLWHAG